MPFSSLGLSPELLRAVAESNYNDPTPVQKEAIPAILAGKENTPEGQDAITTEELAEIVIHGLAEEHFMIATHPWVLEKFAIKARDYDEYIRTLQADIPVAARAAAV